MNDYETQRAAKIAKNQALLAELDIKPLVGGPQQRESRHKRATASDQPPTKKQRLQRDANTAPSRTSARLANAPLKPNYTDEPDIKAISLPRSAAKPRQKKDQKLGSIVKEETEPLLPVKNVADIQSGWADWTPVASEPTRDGNAVFHFADQDTFTPNKSPEEMLREGVFGGSYFRPLRSRKLGIVVKGDWEELPEQWISGLNVERYLTNPSYDADINKFHRSCGQSIEEWEAAGWISHEHDVRGWFQWYCRFFQGRRCEDDERQISRWRKCVGETGRWKRTLLKQYARAGVRTVEDEEDDDGEDGDGRLGISPVVSQTCLHWAWEVRQDDLDRWYDG